MATTYEYQGEAHACETRNDVISLYGNPRVSRKLDTFAAKAKLLGDPTSKEFSNSITKVTLPGFGSDKSETKTIRMHSLLHELLVSAFTQIKDLNLDYELYTGACWATYFRYCNNSTNRKYIRDSSDYDSIRPDGDWSSWSHDCAVYDRDNNRLNGSITYDDGTVHNRKDLLSNHSFGTAIDINSPTNPFPRKSKRATTKFDIPKEIVEILENHGFYWGGYYHDYMHFEYMLDSIDGAPAAVDPGLSFSLPLESIDSENKRAVSKVSLANFFKHTEQDFAGGNFPVGANTTWHGGVHLLGQENEPVYSVAKGTIVAARMPVADESEESLGQGSRNFVLIRHGEEGKEWYSLYAHLASVEMDSDEAKAISWLNADGMEILSGSNYRSKPSTKDNTPISTLQEGDIVQILDRENNPWYKVRYIVDGSEGYLCFDSRRMKEIDVVDDDMAMTLSGDAGTVVEINKPVQAGEIIGYIGKGLTVEGEEPVEKPILHWEVLSPKLFGEGWQQVEDADSDFTCNSEALIKLIDKDRDDKLTASEIIEFYKNEENAKTLRPYACKFMTEWGVDWAGFAQKMVAEGIRVESDKMDLYNFWKDASGLDSTLPSDGHIWHYNPIAFIQKMLFSTARALFSDIFEADKTFPLPAKMKSLAKKVGNYLENGTVGAMQILVHAGIEGDTLDAKELSQKRADVLKGFLKPEKPFFKEQLNNGWGDRERRLMLSVLKNPDGQAYSVGEITDEPIDDAFKAVVKQYQTDYSLSVDGDFGQGSFTKAAELFLEEVGLTDLPEIEALGLGDTHPEESANSNESDSEEAAAPRVLELLLWKDKVEPALSEYDSDAAGTYAQWQAAVTKELKPSIPLSGKGIWIENDEDSPFEPSDFIVLYSGNTELERFKVDDHDDERDGYVHIPFTQIGLDDNYTIKCEFSDSEGTISSSYVMVYNIPGAILLGESKREENEEHIW